MSYNILIPFDFSEQAQNALKNAADLSGKLNASIHIIHVANESCDEATRKKLQTDLLVMQNRFSPSAEINAQLLFGPIGGKILDYASTLKNPVIFISNNSSSEGKHNYTGPNAHFIMANAKCPVLFLKNDLDFKKINTILLPIDLNFENKLKLGYAMFLSKFFDNAMIRLLSVAYDEDEFGLNRLMFRMNHINTFFEKMGVNSVGEVIRCYNEDGEQYSKVAVEYAEKSDAELILLMTNEEKAKAGIGISQEADYMLSHFKNNILSITPFVTT